MFSVKKLKISPIEPCKNRSESILIKGTEYALAWGEEQGIVRPVGYD